MKKQLVEPGVYTPPKGKGPRKTAPRWMVYALAGVAAISFINAASANAASHPAPAASVATPPAVTKTVEVPVTPKACTDALAAADQGFTLSGQAMQYASDGFNAASRLDVAGMQTASEGIKATNTKITALAPQYTSARDECRAGAK